MSKDHSPDVLAAARTFFAAWEAAGSPEEYAELAKDAGVDWPTAWRWMMIVRPKSLKAGGNWPFDDAPLSDTDSKKRADLKLEFGTPEEFEDEEIEDAPAPKSGQWVFDEGYTYNGDTDTYVFFLRQYPSNPYPLPGLQVREIVRGYSNYDGQPATIHQLARAHELPRPVIVEVLKKLGVTHASEPRTPEEMQAIPVDQLIEEDLEAKRHSYTVKLQQADWRQTKKESELYRAAEFVHQRRVEEFGAAMEFFQQQHAPTPLELPQQDDTFLLDLSITDLHFGKLAYAVQTGSEYNREIARRLCLQAVTKLLARALKQGSLEKILFEVGNDLFHVDNNRNVTTKGTPQDVDGIALLHFKEVMDLIISCIDLLEQVAEVDVIIMPGNHDRERAFYLGNALAFYYSNSERVSVDDAPRLRKYYRYGVTVLGKTHGDGPPDAQLPQLLFREAGELAHGTKFQECHVGHKHIKEYMRFVAEGEFTGVRIRRKPSLSATDQWHDEKGYKGTRAAEAYLYHAQEGYAGTLSVSVS